MATVTVVDAQRTLEIEATSITEGDVNNGGHLILRRHDGTEIDVGAVSGMQMHDGVEYQKVDAFSYVGPEDPGDVSDGSVWYDTNNVAGPFATDSQRGLVELATNSEVVDGTDTQRAVTPAGLASIPGTKVVIVSGIVEGSGPSAWPKGVSIQGVSSGSSWTINGGAGTVVMNNVDSTRASQIFYENSGGTASTKAWMREYNSSVGGGGWTAWAQIMLMVNLSPGNFAQSTGRGSYPQGLSRMYFTTSQATNWDFAGNSGEIVTYVDSTDFARQTFTTHSSGAGKPEVWIRTANTGGGWTAWRKTVFQDKSVIAMTSGRVLVTPVANTQTVHHVNFPSGMFTGTPNVVACADTTVMGNQVQGVAVTNVTSTGFDIYLLRTNTTNTWIQWIATQTP